MNEHRLLQLARQSIAQQLGLKSALDQALLDEFSSHAQQATFVTLTIDDQLRGCIGSIIPHRKLLDDILSNAKAAAFHDPRFAPLTQKEFERVRIEISLLTPPKELEYTNSADLKKKIVPKVDGVIIRLGNQQATFLPQVWDELPTFETFFAHLGHKAGLDVNYLERHPEVLVYQVHHFHE